MTKSQSIQLALWWIAIADVQTRIDNEIVPIGINLGVEDPDLMDALEALSEKIKTHLNRYNLQAVPIHP